MKPLGREHVKFPTKTDHHIHDKDLVNWWEKISEPSKKRHRQHEKKIIKKEVQNYGN